MAQNTPALTIKQRRAIAGLLSCPTVGDAAKHAGVGDRTVFRWLSDDANFQTELRRQQDRAIDAAVSRLSGQARSAANTLISIHEDEGTAPAVRVQAATQILNAVLKLKEHRDLAERIEELERKLRVA